MEKNKLSSLKVIRILNEIMEYELAGVVRYTHYSLMVVGPHRLPIVEFLKDQANESLLHAQQHYHQRLWNHFHLHLLSSSTMDPY